MAMAITMSRPAQREVFLAAPSWRSANVSPRQREVFLTAPSWRSAKKTVTYYDKAMAMAILQ